MTRRDLLLASVAAPPSVRDLPDRVEIATATVEAAIRKKGYVSGVAAHSFLDRKTGFRDPTFGLDIADWIMEPGSDEAYRDQLPKELRYEFNNLYHGAIPKRSIEGPQICTKAGELSPEIISGPGFVAVRQRYQYRIAAPGRRAGSVWEQTLVFPAGARYFVSSDRITSVNSSDAMFLRIDLPGHIRHRRGDVFSEVYLSYQGRIPSSEFFTDFPPDAKFLYRRDDRKIPRRMIRAFRLRDPATGRLGPWLTGMTLRASDVSEAWCHQRGYVCMIQEFGGRPVREGESFSAAFLIGYFDSISEMERVYDRYRGAAAIEVSPDGWRFQRSP